jgi:putative acetyltransferase
MNLMHEKLTIKFIESEGPELQTVRELFSEYAEELNENLCFQSFEAELNDPLKKYVQPGGCIILAVDGDNAAGCIALMPLPEQGHCEMKRFYVRPAYRKYGLGRELVERILGFATQHGFKKMKLDTLQKLQPAINLYEHFGFIHTPAYYANPLAGVVYMEKELAT